MIEEVAKELAKKIVTHDSAGRPNGYLVELFKDQDKTVAYLTVASAGAFKGYHLHRVRAARYVCIKGRMKIVLYKLVAGVWMREEHFLDSSRPDRLFIPKGVATGLDNSSDTEAWLVNYPDPAYDPSLKDEQIEYTQEELEKGIVK